MDLTTIIFIAFGLSMDAFAVSIASGCTVKKLKIKYALKISVFFGLFQAFMPVIGWMAGLTLIDFISGFDHWIAFGLLCYVGGKMIYDSIKIDEDRKKIDPLNIYILLLLSIATSVDALAVGLSFAFLRVLIITPVVLIGVVTFILSFIGVIIGDRIGYFFEKRIELIGGLVLIGIGFRILLEHLL
jgi:putative Mn2+ efflux pump MntP